MVELVYGGLTQIGTAGGVSTSDDPYENGNKVTINGGEVTTVFGGSSNNGTAINNQVSITGGTVNSMVYGGEASADATGNKVTIKGGKISSNLIYGGLSKSGSANNNTVEISGGTFDNSYLTIYGGKSVEANNNTVEISVEKFKARGICVGDGATSTGNTLVLGAKGVKIHDSESGIGVIGGVQTIALTDKVQFEDKTTVLKADKFAKDNKTAVNAANFDGMLDISAATGLQGATAPGVMTLLQSDTENNFTTLDLKYKDATGSEQTVNLSGETTSHIVREVAAQEDERANGVKLVYRNTHTVSIVDVNGETKNAVNYTVGNVIGSIDLAQWDSTKDAVAVPTGWTANSSGVTVSTENMTNLPELEAGTSKEILTTETNDFFSDDKISKTNKYKEYDFTPSAASGVTLFGKQSKGVRTAESGKNLEYAVSKMVVSDISFGEMKWGTGRAATTDYDFANTATVKASNLSFTFTDTQKAALSKTSKMTLLSDATNLAADKTVTDASHTQQVDYSVANGAALTGTLTGTVSTAANAVNYAATGMTLDRVDLAKWDGAAASAIPEGWTANTSGVTVETDGMTVPEVEAGKHIDILQSKTDNFFTNAKINGDNAYKASDFTEKAGAITFAGSQSKGVTMDSKQNCLIYAVGTKDVKTATLAGEIGWDTSKAYYTNSQYTFSDSSQIVFANDSSFVSETDPLNQTMTLIGSDSAEHAVKGTVSGTPGFTVKMNNTSLDATVTGAASIESGNLKYLVTAVTLDRVDLAKWDGATASAVPTGWTAASGMPIETDGMTVPKVEAGKHINILQSNTDNFFANAKINGDNAYKASDFTEKEGAITFAGSQSKGVTLDSKKNCLIYAAGTKDVQTATLSGEIAWSDGGVHYTNQQYTFSDASQIVFAKDASFTATADPLNTSMTLIKADSAGHAVKGTVSGMPGFTVKMNNTSLDATVTGAASIDSGNLKYTVTGVTLNKVTVDSVGSDAVPEGWSTATNVQIDTESMTVPTDAAYGQPQNIMTSDKPVFDDSNITGSNKYGENPAAFTDTDSKETAAVTITGTQNAGVKASADKKSLVYEVGKKEASSVKLGTVTWAAGSQLMDGSREEYDYSSVQSVDTGSFVVNYDAPQNIDVSKGESMTLLQANDTLKAMVDEEKKQAYSYTPVTGVTMDANIIGRLANNSGAVTYTPTANKAVSLIFGDVDWLDSGALIDHKTTLTNVSFDGAAVDTTKINFTNKEFMEADKQMTLVSDFGGKPGSITGSKYMVGTGFEGEGSASMEDGNLIFRTKTEAGVSEQTHKTVMAMEADVALLNAGSEHIDNVMTGLGDPANMGEDGTSTSVSVGGGGSRYETGSHVSSHTWNAAVGIGRKRELDKGTLEYGIFGEYGKSSYTLHSDAGKGDGDSHHAGGGLLAKWTNKHDVYTEASFRLGRMSNSASNVLRDAAGNGFGYDVHATYYGAHVGVGKIFRYNGGRSLDVYGKFFYTKRNGVNFTAAAQQYDLDSVASSILRIGARYGTTDRKWNWYGGLAYEYEFDGEAKGTVNGAAVRAASIKGGSGRAEIGMRMNATKTNPWQADISLYGYAGKHRGFGGNISVAYMF